MNSTVLHFMLAILFLDEVGRTEAHDKEKHSMIQLLSILPEDQKNEIMILWEEFESYKSEEAIFV
ncbi:HD domain-containing protein [Fusibacter sp. A1]|nr:HD domain-containing protein [Fusibacter sp. A1]